MISILFFLGLSIFADKTKFYANIGIDFEWPLATKAISYLSYVAENCNFKVKVFTKDSSNLELINQRILQAFKRKNVNITIQVTNFDFKGVVSPVIITLRDDFDLSSNRDILGCFSFNEFAKFCNRIEFPRLSSEECSSKYIEGAKNTSFKVMYFFVMLVILVLTIFLTFFWGKNEAGT